MKKVKNHLTFIVFSLLLYSNCSLDVEKTGALLEVSPTEIRFTKTDTLSVVTVENMGNENLRWKVSSAPEWIIFTKQHGEITPGVSDTFSVTFQKSLLDAIVEYRENIVLSSNVNSVTIQVTFQSEQPNLKVSTTKLEYGLEKNENFIIVSNSGTGYLDWKATTSVDWFTISPDTGHTSAELPDTMLVRIHPDQVPGPGEYTGSIKITSDANGPTFTTKISADISISFYYLGINTTNLRDGKKLIFPVLTYNGNIVPIAAEYYIQPIGQKENCNWEIIAGNLPTAIEFSTEKYQGSSSAKFAGEAEPGIFADLTLRVTDALNSTIEQPVTLISQEIEVVDPEMVSIPAGTFTMGDSWGDGLTVEQPAHDVTLGAFQICKFEVTNEEFYKFVLARGYQNKEYWLITDGSDSDEAGWNYITNNNIYQPMCWSNSDAPWDTCSASNQANSPVVGISWYEAFAYCKWLSQITGKTFRLPREAQWERAARGGGTGSKYPWGDAWNAAFANWNDGGQDDGFVTAAPVGSFENGKSAEGCYDLAGNVWEWCQDWYAPYEAGALSDPLGPTSGVARVVRGGSWKSIPRSLRTVSRSKVAPNSGNSNIGMRLAVWQ